MTTPATRKKVQVWVFSEDSAGKRRVLLLRTLPGRGGFWQPVTGGVEGSESVEAAARRELKEETGLDAKSLFPLGFEFGFEGQREGVAVNLHETCFGAEVNGGDLPVRLDAKEHDAFEWIDATEASAKLRFESNRQSLEKLISRVSDFEALDEAGQRFRLSDAVQAGPVLVAFYPGDFTPVCTKQLCSYRDDQSSFKELGVRVVGISPDTVEKHAQFRKEFSLPFTLLADPDQSIFKKFGMISKLLFGMPGRGVVLVDSSMQPAYRSVEWTPLTYKGPKSLVDAVRKSLKNG